MRPYIISFVALLAVCAIYSCQKEEESGIDTKGMSSVATITLTFTTPDMETATRTLTERQGKTPIDMCR